MIKGIKRSNNGIIIKFIKVWGYWRINN
jgi:hypothetical protein